MSSNGDFGDSGHLQLGGDTQGRRLLCCRIKRPQLQEVNPIRPPANSSKQTLLAYTGRNAEPGITSKTASKKL